MFDPGPLEVQSLSNCPICRGSTITSGVSLTDRRKNLEGVWTVWNCGDCKAGFLNPMPDVDDLKGFYESYYDASNVCQDVASIGGKISDSEGYDKLKRIYHWLTGDVDPRDFLSPPVACNVLDYGCGEGAYFDYFVARGINMFGADLSPSAVTTCGNKGYDVRHIQDLNKIPFPDNKFDFVYAMQVLEHLINPHQLLDELVRVTKPGSAIFLAFPNYTSFWKKLFKTNWISGWFAPFHVIHYSESTIRHLAASHDLIVKSVRSRTPESWFRLNVSALLHQRSQNVSIGPGASITKLFAIVTVKGIEMFTVERDCLIVELVRDSCGE